METLGTIIGYLLLYPFIACVLRAISYGILLEFNSSLEKISIKIKPIKPKLTEPIYNLVKYHYDDYYTIEKYEMKISIEYFKTSLLVLLLYPIFCYHWQYEKTDSINFNISDDDVFKFTKKDFIEMFDKREIERNAKLSKEEKISKLEDKFNEEFETNYNKLNK